ncbi:MAG: cytidine deaminase [Candidatus Ancaeobacter aquaticus]|nr:cytidine deaminase [Candidatus Ancaeobacter aquaticus]
MDKVTLLKKAATALKHAKAPYSSVKVGAALLTKEGKVYTGCNIENCSYGLTMCAERVALFKALSEGYSSFQSLAIFSNDIDDIVPCGACLQILCEYAPKLTIITKDRSGKIKTSRINSFLPKPFLLNDR